MIGIGTRSFSIRAHRNRFHFFGIGPESAPVLKATERLPKLFVVVHVMKLVDAPCCYPGVENVFVRGAIVDVVKAVQVIEETELVLYAIRRKT